MKGDLILFYFAAEQLKRTGASLCITPCHNCHHGVGDVIGHYNIDMRTSFIIDMLVKQMKMPEGTAGE